MPLNTGSIALGATFAPTGGVATTLATLGGDRSGVKLLISDAAVFNLRSTLNVTVVEPAANDSYPGKFTPAKRRVARVKPITLSDGSIFNNQLIQEMIVHPETTAAQITELRSTGVNVLNDADFDGLWNSGSLA